MKNKVQKKKKFEWNRELHKKYEEITRLWEEELINSLFCLYILREE